MKPTTVLILAISVIACFLGSARANNTFDTSDATSLNSNWNGSINPAGDVDFVRIVVPSSGTLRVYTTGDTDTYGRLYNGSRTYLTYNDDGGAGLNFSISRYVSAGTYYIRVSHYSSSRTGSYTLVNSFTPDVTSDDHGNSFSSATGVSTSSTTSGNINYRGDHDYFRITIPSSGSLTVSSNGNTDVYGSLFRGGSLLTSNDDGGTNYNFRITRSVSAGTYYVRVRHYSAYQTGPYSLSVSFTSYSTPSDSNGNFGSADQVTFSGNSATVSGYSIGWRQDNDYFVFDLPSNGVLTVYSTGSTDTYGYLYNSARQLLQYSDDSNGSTNFRIVRSVNAGRYYLRVRHYSTTGTGPYGLQFSFAPNSTLPPTGSGARVAVCVGVSNYAYISDLNLADDDARAIRSMLQADGWSVTLLTDNSATKTAIRNAIQSAVSGADQFLFTFSGHGTRYGTTGYICPHDGSSAGSFISQAELESWLASGSASTRVSVILDSCNSGEFISRNLNAPANRYVQPDDSLNAPGRNGQAATYFRRDLQRNGWTILAGCRGNEFCYELPSLGYGWLSHKVFTFLPQTATDTNRNSYSALEELFVRIRGGYAGLQHPQLFDGESSRHFDIIRVR